MERVYAGFTMKSGYRVLVETRPCVLPTFKVRHPVRDIDIDSIDTGRRDLANEAHVARAPCGCEWRNPDIFIALPDPEGCPAPEHSRRSVDLSLHPVGMILEKRVRRLDSIRRDAFETGDVHK